MPPKQRIGAFFRAEGGNVAMMFGLLLIPLLIGGGMAVDFVRAAEARARLAEASDAGLLAAARAKLRDQDLTDSAATVVARRHFDVNAKAGADLQIDSFVFSFDEEASEFALTVAGKMKTSLLSVVGRHYLGINVDARARVAPPRILEAVLGLDNTSR